MRKPGEAYHRPLCPSGHLLGTALLQGSPLTFVAPATGGVQPLEYQFWRFDTDTGWRKVQEYRSFIHLHVVDTGCTGRRDPDWGVVQDFGGPNTLDWLPNGADAGLYIFQARARRVGYGAVTAFEAIDTKEVGIVAPSADLTVSISSPPITVTAGSIP